MRVSISYPPLRTKGSPMLTQNRQFQWMSVGSFIYPLVAAMAATLLDRAGHEVTWDDGITAGWSMDQWWARLEGSRPGLVVIETKTPVVRSHWGIVTELKQRLPETRVVLIGDHVTAEPEESLRACPVDYVLAGGAYDEGLVALADQLDGRGDPPPGLYWLDAEALRHSGPFTRSQDLDAQPFIDRRLTRAHGYFEKWKRRDPFFYVMAGRDCPRPRCTFCSWTTLYPRFSVRSPGHVLDEIEFLVAEHGVREVFDDTGTFPPGRWREQFCRGMVQRGLHDQILLSSNERLDFVGDPAVAARMKRSGWRKVKVGLESGNQATLDRLDKGITLEDIVRGCRQLSEAGIDVQLTVMVGYPWETSEDARRTMDLAGELMARGYAEMLQATVVIPYPGTPLHAQAVQDDWFRFDPCEYDRYDMTEPVLTAPDMTPKEVMEMCQGVYRSFLRPRFMVRQALRIRSWEDLDYIRRGAVAVWGHLKDFGRLRKRTIRR